MSEKIKNFFRPLFPQTLLNYLYHLPKAMLASRFYGDPAKDLEFIGVTGTDGKTTTATLIYHILKTAKKKVAMVTTVEARIGKKSLKTGFHVTSPDPWQLQKFLRHMRSQKIRYVVTEVTSHGLDQFRFFPIRPKIAVLTNITHEHLDYHKTFQNYVKAKLKLFRHADYAVVNKDLPVFHQVNSQLGKVLLSTYSIKAESQLQAEGISYNSDNLSFKIGNTHYQVPLQGEYNLYNTLAAISSALLLDISPTDIKRALVSFPGIKGRLQEMENDKGLRVFVDFAHTPNALTQLLTSQRQNLAKSAKLIVVFGSAGLRDFTKRPLMGQAGSLADYLVVTSDDPRTEDPEAIAQAILSGVTKNKLSKTKVILDRQKAIDYAINELAKEGDCVLVCGKGHEESMCYGTVEKPWSDQVAVKKALSASPQK